MKVVIFDVETWEREGFETLEEKHEVRLVSEPLDESNASEYSDAEIVSGFIYSEFSAEVLDMLPQLRMIATRSTGFDHVAMDVCRDRGIVVCNVPSYGSTTVAEHVVGLLLTISHRLEEAVDRTRKGDFSPRGLQGFDLYGKTIGIIGTGEIGQEVIRIANGFAMDVIAYDLRPDDAAAESLGFRYVTFETLLAESDVISLHVPSNKKTRHLIGRDEFAQMKDGTVLINTARGDLIESRALIRALAEQKLAAAGLDVLPEEPVIREEAELLRSVYEERHDLGTLLANHLLVHMRNVIVTPHSGFNTREAVQRISETTRENIVAFASGEPIHVVE